MLSLVAAACYNSTSGDAEIHGIARFKLPVIAETGPHRVTVFTEMHYQPKFDSQDVPRLLPPPDSVPVTGIAQKYTSMAQYAPLEIPESVDGAYSRAAAGELYRINCQVCHGVSQRGDGPLVPFMTRGALPADLTAAATQGSADGELFAFISEGGRQGYALQEAGRPSSSPMPSFKLLLTEEERWSLVKYLRGQ